jgi:hypothetical protein
VDSGHGPHDSGRRVRLPDVSGILASQELPALPADAADRIRRALAAESVSRELARGSTYATDLVSLLPRQRNGRELPPPGRYVPAPRDAWHTR